MSVGDGPKWKRRRWNFSFMTFVVMISSKFMTFDNRVAFHCKYDYLIVIIIVIT